MSYEMYRYIFIGGLVLAIVMLLATVAIFFLLDIKSVIGYLTGRSERKGIEDIQKRNESGLRTKKSNEKNSDQDSSFRVTSGSLNTTKIKVQDRYDSYEAGETEHLPYSSVEETTYLNESAGTETTVLNNMASQFVLPCVVNEKYAGQFWVEEDVTYVHSGEIIQ